MDKFNLNKSKIKWCFDNTYSKLSNTFKEDIKPTPVNHPELVIVNEELAKNLKLDFSKIDKKELANFFLVIYYLKVLTQ